jgi:signal transduction histidine kinase
MLLAGQFNRPLARRPTDLAALLSQAVQDVRPFVERRRQLLSIDCAGDLGTLAMDADKIRDCVDNLLLNAIKFTPDGGRIAVAAKRTADGNVEIRITDWGVGVDAANLPHLFKPFFTALDVSRHSSGQFEFGRRGLGLGLSMVKAFVEMHGGKVEVASEAGKGSTFVITLPP